MTEARLDRHLAAIVVADVVGYSRMVEADEAGTLAAFKRCREDILEPLLREFNGRAVKFMGDGALMEFASAVDAVEFSVALQSRMLSAGSEDSSQQPIVFRIGVNLGDIVVDGGDVFGEGVNIAARLEALAEPGGVLVSDAIFRQVKGRTKLGFRDLGEKQMKNMADPVRVYAVETGAPSAPQPKEAKAAAPSSEKISIAVLPFTNMSGDPSQDYFSDGMTEDIITEISRFRELRVIARNSSFQFRDGKSDIREVGRKLDARYVIEGSIRRAGNRIRITVQLIEAASQGHIWSERYDRELVDVFAIQEEIARTIAIRVAGQARTSAVERTITRPTESLTAYDLFLQSREELWTFGGDHDALESRLLRVIELDPQFSAAYGVLADLLSFRFLITGNPRSIDRAVAFGRQGVASNREDAWANYGLGLALIYKRSMSEAGLYLQRAIELNPNDVTFLGIHAMWLAYGGREQEALAAIQEALRRDPYGQEWFWAMQGIVLAMQGKYHDAANSYAKMTSFGCLHYCWMAFSQMKAGDPVQAEATLRKFETPIPGIGPAAYMDLVLPDIVPAFRKDFLDTLRSIEANLPHGASQDRNG